MALIKLHNVKGKKVIIKNVQSRVCFDDMKDIFKPIVSEKLKMNKKFALSKHYDIMFDVIFTGYEDRGQTLFFDVANY